MDFELVTRLLLMGLGIVLAVQNMRQRTRIHQLERDLEYHKGRISILEMAGQ